MGIATDMKKLADDIVVSHDMRVDAIGHLVKDTHKMLRGFDADRRKMSREQASNLGEFVNDLSRDVASMLRGFRKDHKQMSEGQAKSLANFITDLAKDVGKMIRGFQKEHREMATNLKSSLDQSETDRFKGEADRLKDFKGMMGDINKTIKGIENFVAKKLKEFNEEHADMSEALRRDLAKYVRGIVKDTKDLLGAFADENNKMAGNWQALTKIMAGRRSGKHFVSAGAKTMTVGEAVKHKKKTGAKKKTTAKKTGGKKKGRKKKKR